MTLEQRANDTVSKLMEAGISIHSPAEWNRAARIIKSALRYKKKAK